MVYEKLLLVESVADAFGDLVRIPLHLSVHIVRGEEVPLVRKGGVGLDEVMCSRFGGHVVEGTDKERFALPVLRVLRFPHGGEGLLCTVDVLPRGGIWEVLRLCIAYGFP